MAPIISFAWTTPALLAGEKTVTRRDWDPNYARRFRKGMEVLAYDRQPRNGGKPIARLRLTEDARYEPDANAPDSDWAAEGFQFFRNRYGAKLKNGRDVSLHGFNGWRDAGGSSWVVRFEVIEYLSGPLSKPASSATHPASSAPHPASSAAKPASNDPEPGPWTRSDLDEWRCPKCGQMSYTTKAQGALMVQCSSCPGLVWMEQLFGVAA